MTLIRHSAIAVVFLASIYQFWFKELIFEVLGVGRAIEPIENFPWSCGRVRHPQLEGCEDLALDETGRVLYAACSGSIARSHWNQGLSKFNVSGRRPEGSELMAVYIDEPTSNDQFRMHKIEPRGYDGARGDGTLDLVGFDVDKQKESKLQFWLINQRPPVDDARKYLDATKLGNNVTVDVFDYSKGTGEMNHVKTISDPHIYAANGLALTEDGGFVVTNDASAKVGLRKEFDLFLGGGNVVTCGVNDACRPATSGTLRFANGLVRGKDGLIYVPFAGAPFLAVYRPGKNGSLKEVARIKIGMPVDNLSVDSNGDIWAIGLPKLFELIEAIAEPFSKSSPSTIFRIRKKSNNTYETIKVLEDAEAKVLSGATVAVFDRPTKKLFIGGAATPFIAVCKAR